MTLTRLCLGNPVAVMVAVILLLIFGAISLERLPVQLTPEVSEPEISITTRWRAAAPEEVESAIVVPQEEALRGLPGATELLSQAQRGRARIDITFAVGTDLRRALLEVMNRLNRVPSYPADADEPIVSTAGGNSRPIAWFIIKPLPGNERDIATYQDFVEDVVQTRLERVPGVSMSEVRGGRENEVRITFDPYRAASLGIELPRVVRLAGSDDVTGGFANVGKRRYTLRFQGAFDVGGFRDLILDWRDGQPVRLGDVADVAIRPVDRESFVLQNGRLAIAVNAHREIAVNVLDVMSGLQAAVAELRDGPLARAGLSIEQVYDETVYIHRSIRMVVQNLLLGIVLATVVLWWFFRRLRATLMVATAIPISVLGSFVLLDAFGRTINVISLAGMALAVGMVLDAAIIVLENIVRLRERGRRPDEAAIAGTAEVWGALLASTATTVAIFLPIVFLEDESGQLFADLALTIAVAIGLSLPIALTVLPTGARQWLAGEQAQDRHASWWEAVTRLVMRLTDGPWRRGLWIATLLTLPVVVTLLLRPEADYLPDGNRNLVFTFINPPPGHSIDAIEKEMGEVIAERLQPYLDGEKQPKIHDYFFVAFSSGVFMGLRAEDPTRTAELLPIINRTVHAFPDTIGFAFRASLFGGFGSGHSVNMDIQGSDVGRLLQAAGQAFGMIRQILPGASIRPFPGLDLSSPELRLHPDGRGIAEAGWDRQTLAAVVRAFGDGLYIGDHFDGDRRLDIVLRAEDWRTPEELMAYPVATPSGVRTLAELVHLERTSGPAELRRIDRRRTVTLQIRPPEGMSLDAVMEILKQRVEPAILASLPNDATIAYSGTADKLETALGNMTGVFALAIVILYLLMSALFRSFLDSLLVLLVVPLATVGGVVALRLLGLLTFQPMDLLTMIGFVILLGLVVNNAILLVHQTRVAERRGRDRRAAVSEAVRRRLRPILMSTLTSLFGMLPLLVNPGAGSELYRGLAAVIVGGMTVSTLFTLILLPSLLRIGEGRPRPTG